MIYDKAGTSLLAAFVACNDEHLELGGTMDEARFLRRMRWYRIAIQSFAVRNKAPLQPHLPCRLYRRVYGGAKCTNVHGARAARAS